MMDKFLSSIGAFLLLFPPASVSANPWEASIGPYGKTPLAIGSYANGCLFGAEALAFRGQGYQVIRTSRNRYYGHPRLIEFIQDYAVKTRLAAKGDLLIADMSMPRGGHFEQGHASHQIGLDADIWFKLVPGPLSPALREEPIPGDLVDEANFRIRRDAWKPEYDAMIRLAAQDRRVARIFVNPAIKQRLCNLSWQDDAWLRKVRPWWGHTYHMHVRLTCPDGDSPCHNQASPPKGNGCEELAWWKTQMRRIKARKQSPGVAEPLSRVVRAKPARCELLLAPD